MAKSFTALWLGDEDPSAQIIRMGDLRFIRGEKTSVPGDHQYADMIRDNPTFAVDGAKADVVEADEPSDEEMAERMDEGTVKGALKAQLKALGVDTRGNPSEDTLRNKLAEATK